MHTSFLLSGLAVVSTGKSDWIHSVGDDKATLAGQLESVAGGGGKGGKGGGAGGLLGKLGKKLLGGGGPAPEDGPIKGVFASSVGRSEAEVAAAAASGAPGKLGILNSSFFSSSAEHDHQSVLVFPDFKVVHDVPGTGAGAGELYERYLAAGVGRAGAGGKGTLRSWPLPYHAVVLMCSHKKRDARCSQAAPILLAQVSPCSSHRLRDAARLWAAPLRPQPGGAGPAHTPEGTSAGLTPARFWSTPCSSSTTSRITGSRLTPAATTWPTAPRSRTGTRTRAPSASRRA